MPGGRPLFVFPLNREARPFRRCWPDCRVAVVGPGRLAGPNVAQLIDSESPSVVVLAGFAGALSSDWAVGDVGIAESVIDAATGEMWQRRDRAGGRAAKILTLQRPALSAERKAEIHQSTGADLIDLESSGVVAVCCQRGVDWRVVRVVSDDAATTIPEPLGALVSEGEANVGRVIALMFRNPAIVPHLMRLARDTDRAARALASSGEIAGIMST